MYDIFAQRIVSRGHTAVQSANILIFSYICPFLVINFLKKVVHAVRVGSEFFFFLDFFVKSYIKFSFTKVAIFHSLSLVRKRTKQEKALRRNCEAKILFSGAKSINSHCRPRNLVWKCFSGTPFFYWLLSVPCSDILILNAPTKSISLRFSVKAGKGCRVRDSTLWICI